VRWCRDGGGHETVERGTPKPEAASGTALGKRYVNSDETLEILCTKAATAHWASASTLLSLKEAKPLPASD
jgi:hypothetical protein